MSATQTEAPPIVRATSVPISVERAFSLFTEQIGAWWPLHTHGLYIDQAQGVDFRDGVLVERSEDGAEAIWGSVLAWEPPQRFVISWHPGRESEEASEVEVLFEATDGGTRVILEHRGWEAFGSEAMIRRHGYVGPKTWGYVLDHFSDVADPPPAPT